MSLVGDIAPALIAGAFSAFGASKQNEEARHRSIEQMKFQKMMSNTSYQRSMRDMKKAGLNPILAYKQGGASTPGGAMAPTVNEMEPAVNSAMQARRLTADVKAINAGIANTKQSTLKMEDEKKKIRGETAMNRHIDRNVRHTTKILASNQTTAAETATLAKIKTLSAAAAYIIQKQQAKLTFDWLKSPTGQGFWKADIIGRAVNPGSSAFSAASSGLSAKFWSNPR